LEFLEPWLFRVGTPQKRGWKSLDFLGFSRVKRDISMGYAGFSLQKFSETPLPLWAFAAAERKAALWGRAELFIEQA
jgi:hypothetical protein